jgi:hypothetical protein
MHNKYHLLKEMSLLQVSIDRLIDFYILLSVALAVKGGYLAENGPPEKGPLKTQGSCCRVWNRTTPECWAPGARSSATQPSQTRQVC